MKEGVFMDSRKVQGKYSRALEFTVILLACGILVGCLLSKWINQEDIESLSSAFLATIVESSDLSSSINTQCVSNCLFLLLLFALGFSLWGIPIIAFILFSKGVQVGFSCVLYLAAYNIKGIIGILCTLLPQILLDTIAMVLVAVVSIELSWNLLRCACLKDTRIRLLDIMNQKLNTLLLSLILLILSSWIKSIILLKLMEWFAQL